MTTLRETEEIKRLQRRIKEVEIEIKLNLKGFFNAQKKYKEYSAHLDREILKQLKP